MFGLGNLELALIMIAISLLVLLRLWRILSKMWVLNDGLDTGTMVDQLLASNIDSLLNRYTLIWENHGAALSLVLEALSREVWSLGERLELKPGRLQGSLKGEPESQSDENNKHLNAFTSEEYEDGE